MASTYVNDLRLNEMATGDASGSWGTNTNTNLELIAEAFSFGTEGITTNADTHTTTIADGATDPGRSMFLKYTGTLDSACTITIGPNTVSKLWFIENATSGSQNIIISQGSGANITIPAGQTKAIYSDGAGSGAAMVDAFATLNVVDLLVDDDLTVTDDAAIGGTALVTGVLTTTAATVHNGGITLPDSQIAKFGTDTDMQIFHNGSSATIRNSTGSLVVRTDAFRVLNDANSEQILHGDADGAVTAYFNNAVKLATTNTGIDITGGFAATAASTITTSATDTPLSLIYTGAAANVGPVFDLYRNSSSPAAGDRLGSMTFRGRNDNSQDVTYATFRAFASDVSDGSEDTEFEFTTILAGTEVARMTTVATETVFNQASADIDFRVESNGNANMLFVDGGNDAVVIGESVAHLTISGGTPAFQVSGEGFGGGAAIVRNDNGAFGPFVALTKSRNTTPGSFTIVQNNDNCGTISWFADDGTNLDSQVAVIAALIDSTPGENDTPGRLVFSTTADGAAAATERLRIDSSGNVIIANTGGTLITTTAGTSNLRLGANAGNSISASSGGGNFNVVVGDEAGTAISTGDQNVAVGFEALKAVSTNSNNTAVGYRALLDQSGGDGNIAVGASSLENLTNASRCTAVGTFAGLNSLGADDCTFIGHDAGLCATTAGLSTFVGSQAGQGIDSVKLTGNENTAIGMGAGLVLQGTANRNTIVGTEAAASMTTGFENTCLGVFAGDAITTGNNNIILGASSDVSAADQTNGICIGVGITAAANDFSFGKASNVVTNDFDADANWSRSSDERLKKNITNQTLGLDFINDLRTVKYNWKASNELDSTDSQLAHLYKEDAADNEMNTDAVMHNFIAQEVKAALDTAGVSEFGGWKEDQYGVQQVSREMFVIPLVKAVQELSTKLDAALARIATLEG